VASERLSRAPASHPVRRIVLISDGHANIGPSDPQSLGALAGNATEWGTQVTAIGVGLDYDERTLGTLAVRSSGRLYHLERPHQMAQILDRELNLLARTVATDAFIEVVPAKGVTILEGTTFGSSLEGNRLKVPLGSLHAGQQREVLFRAKVDTARVGRRPLATARLSFKHPAGSQRRVVQRRPIRYRVTRQAERAQASQSPRVAAMVATHRAASAQLAAADRLNQGDAEAAVAQLETAERELRTAARQAPAPVRRQLLERARKVQTTRSRARGAGNRPADSRGAALEAFDGAYEAQGF
jgi:Ca-activated chloride channel family protein